MRRKIDNEVWEERGQPAKMGSVIENVTLKKIESVRSKNEMEMEKGGDNDVMESRER